MRYEKDFSVVDFELQTPTGEVISGCQMSVDFVPRFGDTVKIYSHRDENGNYMNEEKSITATQKIREVLIGKVFMIEHTIEERGRNSRENHRVQFVKVCLRKID